MREKEEKEKEEKEEKEEEKKKRGGRRKSGSNIVHLPLDQTDERSLSAAGRPDQCDTLAGLDAKGEVPQD